MTLCPITDALRVLARQHMATAREMVQRERRLRESENRFHCRSSLEHTADALLRILRFVAPELIQGHEKRTWIIVYNEAKRQTKETYA